MLENIEFTQDELDQYMGVVGCDLFTTPLVETLHQFTEAKIFGSLIRPIVTDVAAMQARLETTNVSGHLFLSQTHKKVQQILRQADYLSPKYHVVIANPPYMGSKGMDGRLSEWAKSKYPNTKADLFAMFMERCIELATRRSFMGMINLPSWLFLTTFEPLRHNIIENHSIDSLLHMGRGIFGIDWGSTAFVLRKSSCSSNKSYFFRLHKRNFQHIHYKDIGKLCLNAIKNREYKYDFDAYRDNEGNIGEIKEAPSENGQRLYYEAVVSEFTKIPGSPIAYWASGRIREIFQESVQLSSIAPGQNRDAYRKQ